MAETIDLPPLESMTHYALSQPGVVSVERLADRLRITPLRNGRTDVVLINDAGGCIAFDILVRPR